MRISTRLVVVSIAAAFIVAAVLRSCGQSEDSTNFRGSPLLPAVAGGEASRTAPTRSLRSRAGPPNRPDTANVEGPRASVTAAAAGALIVGGVATEDGVPVPGAFVALRDLDASEDTAVTGADGRFALDAWASYSAVRAVAIRGEKVWRGSAPADGAPLDLAITLRPERSADRTVLVHVVGHDGGSVAGAIAERVAGRLREPRAGIDGIAVRAAGGWFPVRALRWRIDPDPPVFLVADARDEAGRPLPYGSALVTVDPHGATSAEVRLPPGETLAGRVELPDGGPAPGAEVTLDPPAPEGYDADHMERPRVVTTTTDVTGRFAFAGLSRGHGTLRVAGHDDAHAGSGAVSAMTGSENLVVRLRHPVALRVVVTGDTGNPVADAHVEATGNGEAVRRAAQTGGDGACILEGLPARAAIVLATSAPGFVPSRRFEAVAPEIHVRLERAATISGHVLGPDGAPISGVSIAVEPRGESRVVWGAEGGFEVRDVLAGSHATLSLVSDGRLLGATPAVAGANGVALRWPSEDDRLTMVLPGGTQAWPWGGVTLRDEGRVVASVPSPGRVVAVPATGLPPLVDVQVGPTAEGRYAWLRRVPSRGFLRLALSEGARLRGRVTAPEDGDIGLVECRAATLDGFSVAFESRADGTFDVPGLPPGTVTLLARSREGLSGVVRIDVPATDARIELEGRSLRPEDEPVVILDSTRPNN